MNKLKEINGKFYQEAEVVMLATNKNLKIGDLGLSENNILWYIKESNFKEADVLYECKPQHLYFLIAEEIKEGDWCYNKITKQITQAKTSFYGNFNWVKIIATTDISLGLPHPSQSFIQAFIKVYNESKPITKVLVEVEYIVTNEDWSKNPVQLDGYSQLKVNSSNEITIKKIKDSWAREEVSQMLADFLTDCWNKDYQFNGLAHDEVANKFIEENL